MRSGKRTLFVTEQFAFQQVLGNGAAIDHDKRTIFPGTLLMERVRDKFLPRPAFSKYQDGHIRRPDLPDGFKELLHRGTTTDNAVKTISGEPFLHDPVVLLQMIQIVGTIQDNGQHIDLHGLLHEVVGAPLDRGNRVPAFVIAGDDDDLDQAIHRQQLIQ